MTTPHLIVSILCCLLPAVTLGYLGMCAAFPYGNCRRCHGTGRLYSHLVRSAFRLCPRCDATGRRIRTGRRIYEYLRTEHHRSQP